MESMAYPNTPAPVLGLRTASYCTENEGTPTAHPRHLSVKPGLKLKEVQMPPFTTEPIMHTLADQGAVRTGQRRRSTNQLEVDAPARRIEFDRLHTPRCLQAQRAGEQRLNTNCHLKNLQGFKHRPVGLWTTRGTELPTSPTGLYYYDGFSQSNSTRNDEGPFKLPPVAAGVAFR